MDSFKVSNDDPALSDVDIKSFEYFSRLQSAPMVTNEKLEAISEKLNHQTDTTDSIRSLVSKINPKIDERLDRLEASLAEDYKLAQRALLISELSFVAGCVAAITGVIALLR